MQILKDEVKHLLVRAEHAEKSLFELNSPSSLTAINDGISYDGQKDRDKNRNNYGNKDRNNDDYKNNNMGNEIDNFGHNNDRNIDINGDESAEPISYEHVISTLKENIQRLDSERIKLLDVVCEREERIGLLELGLRDSNDALGLR